MLMVPPCCNLIRSGAFRRVGESPQPAVEITRSPVIKTRQERLPSRSSSACELIQSDQHPRSSSACQHIQSDQHPWNSSACEHIQSDQHPRSSSACQHIQSYQHPRNSSTCQRIPSDQHPRNSFQSLIPTPQE